MEDQNNTLSKWQGRYQRALMRFEDKRIDHKRFEKQFNGDRSIYNENGVQVDTATSKYNMTQELIEAQIDSNIPLPSVQPRKMTERNRELADIIAAALRGEMDRMSSEEMNDMDERLTRVMGGSVYLTEWDNGQSTHDTVGELANRLVSPMEFIPQETVYDPDRMDYFFLAFDETKTRIKEKYGKDVQALTIDPTVSERSMADTEDLVTQKIVFYKEKGVVGCYSWAEGTELFDEKNYFARKDKVCVNCGKTQAPGEKECICGSNEWERRDKDYETLKRDVTRSDGVIIPMVSPIMNGGDFVMEDYQEQDIDPHTGYPVFNRELRNGVVVGEEPALITKQRPAMQPTKIPYYKPKDFPISVRKNISTYMSFFGKSDCDSIADQQNQANKAMKKIDEKIAAVSDFFTKPRDLNFALSNGKAGSNILNVETPDQLQMIKALSLKFDMMAEYTVIEKAYYQAKGVLGITDTFQGKADPTAQSGRAKEIQVARSAGIQRSKATMKNAAYARMYRNMFWFLLAYADEPRSYTTTNADGKRVEKVFNRYDFLEQDEWGNWYYNDDFLFSIDEAGAMQNDKQFLLEDVRTDFSMGAFGNQQDPNTMLIYWKEKEIIGYPNAKRMVKHWEDMIEQMRAEAERQAALQKQQMDFQQQQLTAQQENDRNTTEATRRILETLARNGAAQGGNQ